MIKLLTAVLALALVAPHACRFVPVSRGHSPELAEIIQRYWIIEPATDSSPQMHAIHPGDCWERAVAMHNDCMAAGLDVGAPVRAVINGVPIYWANGYAEVDERRCILLVTADPDCPATAIGSNTGTAIAWAGARAEANAGASPRPANPQPK